VVVEELTFEVEAEVQDLWLAREHEVWGPFLTGQAGFVRKEVWRPLSRPGRVHVLVWWASLEAWKAVPPDAVEAVEAQMGHLRRPCTSRAHAVLREAPR
jgi:uncharacterized protein (TIGR03792 family)